jgi:hypothetical protein
MDDQTPKVEAEINSKPPEAEDKDDDSAEVETEMDCEPLQEENKDDDSAEVETKMDCEAPEAENKDDDSAEVVKTKKRVKRKKKKGSRNLRLLGSAKGIETMFRNAYRAELEIITLAATKANIMISMNGFIASALMISGAFIYASSPEFMIPATVFLLTSAVSIYFALLAASPEMSSFAGGLLGWFKAFFTRRASIRDFKSYIRPQRDFVDGKSNILIYEDRVKLSKAEHWDRMQDLLKDQEDVYAKMSDQLYWLGQMAARKFRMLRASYSAFRWGLIFSVLAFFSVELFQNLVPVLNGGKVVRLRNVGISQFEDVYEPSGLLQLPDGRILVVEDEAESAFKIMRFLVDGSLAENPAINRRLLRSFRRKLSDLEGLSMDQDGFIYATTSHSRDAKGRRKPEREQLLRFRILGDAAVELSFYGDLVENMRRSAVLQQALSQYTDQPVNFSDINIEGLHFDQKNQRLLLGFREPVIDGKSLIVKIDNPKAIFEQQADPSFVDVALLDLQGGGIRSLSFDPILNLYLIVNEIAGYEGNLYSQLWSWSGEPESKPEPIALPEIINLKNVESIGSVIVNSESRLLIMSDEGNAKKQKPARYMLLGYGQLSTDE